MDTGYRCRTPISEGHKISLRPIPKDRPIIKFGHPIGFASVEIDPGDHVHTHNLVLRDVDIDYQYATDKTETPLLPPEEQAVFQGFVRSDGRIGTRNYIGVLPTVNCSAGVARFIAEEATRDELPKFPDVDGIVALGHGAGCCMNPDDEGFAILQRTMAGYTRHPNFFGIVLVGLGCEVNQVECLMDNMGLSSGPAFRIVDIQKAGGTRKSVAEGLDAVRDMLPAAADVRREPISAKHLVVGLECGGSDAYSGISANPALGEARDFDGPPLEGL